ncbi:MAG: hypothetical protein IPM98_09040 [Lewinellaceae bacterium]|nr:hypothetical protein [Lewinellaceae bacterium]
MDKSVLNPILILAIAAITIGCLIGIFRKQKEGFGPFTLKIYGLTLVIGVGAIMTLAEVEQDRFTAFMGILIAIAGYLFGIENKNGQGNKPSGDKP